MFIQIFIHCRKQYQKKDKRNDKLGDRHTEMVHTLTCHT